MKTAGLMLRDRRLEKKLELTDVTRVTKIRPEFLTSIENDDYSRLPSGATARGFISNYAQFLGLNPHHVLAVFRRDFLENQQGQIVPRGVAEPVSKTNFWTPKTTVIALVACVFVVFGAYLIYQYRILTGPPPLKVSFPTEQFTTSENSVVVSGVTDPEATISINGELVALEKGGTFSLRVPLIPGNNDIKLVATSKSGRITELIRRVNLTSTP